MDGHDAPISILSSRPEEGLQHNPRAADSVDYAEAQQAPSPFPEGDDRPQSIPWETHPRRFSSVHETRRGSISLETDSRRGSENSTLQVFASPLRRQTTTTMSGISENTPQGQDSISPSVVDRQELDSQATKYSTKESKDVPPSETPTNVCWNHPYLRRLQPRRKAWRYILPVVTLIFLGILIALIVLYTYAKHFHPSASSLSIIIATQSLVPPLADTALSAANLIYSTLLSTSSSPSTTTLLAYTISNNSICIRTSTSSGWLTPIQCITSLSPEPKPRTPLAILDWYGGPSIYYISNSNQICGIDNIPQNNSWVPSILNTQVPAPTAHPQSQLSTVTWLNGSSSWLYFQDSTLQLREYGLDDYRDKTWRYGALGPLGLAIAGSGIGTARYLLDGGEVLEVFVQTNNNALHGRVFADAVWEASWYSVDGTDSGLSPNAAVTATTLSSTDQVSLDGRQETDNKVFLAWTDSEGFVNVQSRGTVNVTEYNAFSAPRQIVEGDGADQPGLAATGSWGARVDFANGEKILELSEGGNGTDVKTANWTSVDVTSL